MKNLLSFAFAASLITLSAPAAAHSLKELESDLHDQERYAQFVDQAAPPFRLADAEGQPLGLEDLHGKVVVLNFIYTRCKEACPVHMSMIARLQDMMNVAGMSEQVQFITIATDTEDLSSTRQTMREYGKNFQLEPDNWRFLFRADGAPADQTQRVADAYGLKFSVVEEGVQMHGVVTHVIDQTGQLRARFHGLRFEPVNLVSYVNALVNDDHSRN